MLSPPPPSNEMILKRYCWDGDCRGSKTTPSAAPSRFPDSSTSRSSKLTRSSKRDRRRMPMSARADWSRSENYTINSKKKAHVDYWNHPYHVALQSGEDVINDFVYMSDDFDNNDGHESSTFTRHSYADRASKDQRNLQKKRKPFNGWKPIRVWVNTDYMDITLADSPNDLLVAQKIEFLKEEVFPEAVNILQDIFRVWPALRLEIDKDSACPGYGVAVQYDLVIFALTECDQDNDGDGKPDSGRIANGRSCQRDQFDRPVAGFARICLDMIDIGDPNGKRFVLETILHEFIHIMGFYHEDYALFRHPRTGRPRTPIEKRVRQVVCVDGKQRIVIAPGEDTVKESIDRRTNEMRYEIVTETVTAVARNQFNCDRLTGALLENKQGNPSDCFGSHWKGRLYRTEFMSASASSTDQFLSPLTVALLEDSGWYRADFSSQFVKMSPFGRLAGCDFVYEDCIVNGQVPSYSQGSFCTSSTKPLGCDPTHRHVAHCSQYSIQSGIPPAFQYFSDPSLGGKSEQLDYCPIYGTTKLTFTKGFGDGSDSLSNFYEIDCTDESLMNQSFVYEAETFGESSKCFETDFERPLCLKASCSKERRSVEVVFGNTIQACLYDNQKIAIPSLPGYSLTCPRLAQVCPELLCDADCSGRGVCDPPLCVCNDPSDTTANCAYSPVTSLVPTMSPAPTVLEGTEYGGYSAGSVNTQVQYLHMYEVVISTLVLFLGGQFH